jgi:hypothetical protein
MEVWTELDDVDEAKAFIRFVRGMPNVRTAWRNGLSMDFKPTVGVTFQGIDFYEDCAVRLAVYKTLFANLRAQTYDAFREARVAYDSHTTRESHT